LQTDKDAYRHWEQNASSIRRLTKWRYIRFHTIGKPNTFLETKIHLSCLKDVSKVKHLYPLNVITNLRAAIKNWCYCHFSLCTHYAPTIDNAGQRHVYAITLNWHWLRSKNMATLECSGGNSRRNCSGKGRTASDPLWLWLHN